MHNVHKSISSLEEPYASLSRAVMLLIVAASTVVVTGQARGETIEVRVASGTDDSEENPFGAIDLGSSDLEIGAQGGGSDAQWVGVRFRNIGIPRGAIINNASIQFTVDETDDEVQPAPLQIFGELGSALPFTSESKDISSRKRTTEFVEWLDIPAWEAEGDATEDQQTPDIAPVIQSIVNQSLWAPNNALVVVLSPLADFERTAEAYNGSSESAALLTIEFDPTQRILFGDFNDDGDIDSADFTILAENFHTGTSYQEGDITFDGAVDLFDFGDFRRAFAGAAMTAAAQVPEPSGATSLMAALITLWGARRRRR